jgi:FixJ family two-component response regulator
VSSSDLPNDNRPLVCIVDDDLSIQESLSSLFRSAGLKVEIFPSAAELLGVRPTTLISRIEKLGLRRPDQQTQG